MQMPEFAREPCWRSHRAALSSTFRAQMVSPKLTYRSTAAKLISYLLYDVGAVAVNQAARGSSKRGEGRPKTPPKSRSTSSGSVGGHRRITGTASAPTHQDATSVGGLKVLPDSRNSERPTASKQVILRMTPEEFAQMGRQFERSGYRYRSQWIQEKFFEAVGITRSGS